MDHPNAADIQDTPGDRPRPRIADILAEAAREPRIQEPQEEPVAVREMTHLEKAEAMAREAWTTAQSGLYRAKNGRTDGLETTWAQVKALASLGGLFGSLATDERLNRMEEETSQVQALQEALDAATEALTRAEVLTDEERMGLYAVRQAASHAPDSELPVVAVLGVPRHLAHGPNVARMLNKAAEAARAAIKAEADVIAAEMPLGHQAGQA